MPRVSCFSNLPRVSWLFEFLERSLSAPLGKKPLLCFLFFFINLVQKSILLLSFLFLIFCLACHFSFINFLSIFPEARIISECCRILGFSKLVYKLFVFGDDDIH